MKRVLLLEDEFYRYEKLVHAPVRVFWAKNEYEVVQLLKAGPYDIMVWDRDLGPNNRPADQFVHLLDLSKVKDHIVWSWNDMFRNTLAAQIYDHLARTDVSDTAHAVGVIPFGPEFFKYFADVAGYDQCEVAAIYEAI